ncbi:MAG: hypothetical protein MUP60_01125, partial [Candidatus Thorarchaeota archaeon]|nr:hypothetical protein [Candidatus Thorarchaeota archaeon]
MDDTKKVKIKRELWKDGHYHSVVRVDGKRVTWKRWHGRKTTETLYESSRVRIKEITVPVKPREYRPAKASGFKDFPRDHKVAVEQYKIIFKVTAGSAGEWFAVKQSPKPELTAKEIKAIELELIDSYH